MSNTRLPNGRALVSIAVDAVPTWKDISDATNSVSVPEQTQLVGEAYVLGDDHMHVGAGGKFSTMDVEIKSLWTDTDADKPWKLLFDLWDAGGKVNIFFKYAPEGPESGNTEFIAADASGTAAAVPVTGITWPTVDQSSDLMRCVIKLKVPRFIDATIA